jgi:hypothetical protein
VLRLIREHSAGTQRVHAHAARPPIRRKEASEPSTAALLVGRLET